MTLPAHVERMRDAVVVGGGPAGALAAAMLAQRGWSVTLIDARRPGARKTCGHCLNPRGLAVLWRAGLGDAVDRIAPERLRRLCIHRPGRRPMEARLDRAQEPGRLTDRSDFDPLLLSHARDRGVEILQPASARLERLGPGAAVVRVRVADRTERLSTALAVGADGLNSALGRRAGLANARSPGRKFGFSTTVDVAVPSIIDTGAVHMYMLDDGYLGVVRHRSSGFHLAGLIDRGAASPASPAAFLGRAAARFPELRAPVEAARDGADLVAAGPMPCRPRTVASGAAALIGDAAGYVEPLTGEGMSWALESAALLDQVAATARPGGWTGAHSRAYSRLWRREIGARQRACRLAARLAEQPGLINLLGALAGVRSLAPALFVRAVTRRSFAP